MSEDRQGVLEQLERKESETYAELNPSLKGEIDRFRQEFPLLPHNYRNFKTEAEAHAAIERALVRIREYCTSAYETSAAECRAVNRGEAGMPIFNREWLKGAAHIRRDLEDCERGLEVATRPPPTRPKMIGEQLEELRARVAELEAAKSA
jgi:hypothetical protein